MQKIKQWLSTTPYKDYTLSVASADASFRKYYRLTNKEQTVLLMDSSLEKESLKPFIEISSKLLKAGVNTPQIFLANTGDGFLILEDFGNTHYLDKLSSFNYISLYRDAIDVIVQMQKASTDALPLYDKKFLHFEMSLMQEWYIEKLLKKALTKEQKQTLTKSLESISEVVLQQPQNLFVHRDFHSRNIMLTSKSKVGVIDYQDAMCGALTYDLVSLLKDCYIEFDRDKIELLALEFRDKKALDVDDETFLQWFDFMGMQRHIKVLGIFARLSLRDNKEGYLKDIPLTLKYLLDTASRYKQTQALSKLLKELQ